MLYSESLFNLWSQGLISVVRGGFADSVPIYDSSCFVCPAVACTCPAPVTKRDLVRREAGVSRREANVERVEKELSRRMLAVADRERALAEYS